MIYLLSFFLYLLSGSSTELNNSEIKPDPYPTGYFIFPIDPGRQASLSGSFGDIRINHFHAGLDIRTGGREGKTVYAAAGGYVSRIRVSRGGYGNALYITHPNGYVTVYGHLKEYAEPIKKRLLREHYNKKSWELDVMFNPDELPVKKGEMVALSGNTGGSGGPHLHFEIRDAEENTLDPSLFGFSEVKDNRAPVVEYVSLRCMSPNARINGEFGNFDFPVIIDGNGNYKVNASVRAKGDIGLELYTYDKSHTSPFKLGIKSIDVKMDDSLTYAYKLDRLSFFNKIDMNLHTNYKRMIEENDKLHKGYIERGNTMKFYQFDQNMGVLRLEEGGEHEIEIFLKDTYENTRYVNMTLRADESGYIPNRLGRYENHKAELFDSIIKITAQKTGNQVAAVFQGSQKVLQPAYETASEEVYLIDLRNDLFTQYAYQGGVYDLPVTHHVSPEKNIISEQNFSIDFEDKLYHPLFVNIKEDGQKFYMDKDDKPLSGRFSASWKTNKTAIDQEKDKLYITSGRKPVFVGGEWEGQTIKFKPKEFGTYEVLRDKEPPSIRTVSLSSSKLVFKISDSLSGISSFECRVNGEWLMMEYEYKNGLIWSERADDKPISGDIVLTVTDRVNNTKTYKTKI
ncbi:M23 family metallopeptidase [Jiulongibacter sp. NS-SX5]|uniref:M23 family metallopeptidase n=1 Tax=Jiulongibacter sp. NS-SX5 TaxID=3463854 RepID=UPI0040599207